MNIVDVFNNKQIDSLLKDGKVIPEFRAGDSLSVEVVIKDGESGATRVQTFEGLCIAKSNAGIHTNFSVRKLCTGNIWMLRKFFVYSTSVNAITVIKKGKVRKSKLYYMLERYGKSSRIAIRNRKSGK